MVTPASFLAHVHSDFVNTRTRYLSTLILDQLSRSIDQNAQIHYSACVRAFAHRFICEFSSVFSAIMTLGNRIEINNEQTNV